MRVGIYLSGTKIEVAITEWMNIVLSCKPSGLRTSQNYLLIVVELTKLMIVTQ